jgi:LPXTG-motif cell wall-anchored protein
VTELVAPPGYLLDPTDNSEEVTVGAAGEANHDAEVTFENHRQWLALDVSKTADGANNTLYLWGIEKMIAASPTGPWFDGKTPIAPLIKTVDPGGNTALYYQVVVTEEGVQTSNYVVSGTITVHNPNDAPVTATIHESLANCVIDGGAAGADVTRAVAPDVNGVGTDYGYSCNLGNGPVAAGTNTATITWDRSDYPQSADDLLPANADAVFTDEGSDGYTFVATETGKTVTVDDDHFDFPGGWTITAGDQADGTYESPVYSIETGTQPGTCSPVITNTASLVGTVVPSVLARVTGPPPLQTSESGQVCVNAVPIVLPPKQQPHPHVLPNTGGPDAWVFAAGLAMLLGGGALVLADQRRKRRS